MVVSFLRRIVLVLLLCLGLQGYIVVQEPNFAHAELSNSLLQKPADEGTISCLQLKKQMETNPLAGVYLGKKLVCGSMTLADIPYYIKMALEFFFNLVGSLAVIAIMWSGVKYMRSKDKEAADARKQLRSALVGLLVFFGSFAIVRILSFIFTSS